MLDEGPREYAGKALTGGHRGAGLGCSVAVVGGSAFRECMEGVEPAVDVLAGKGGLTGKGGVEVSRPAGGGSSECFRGGNEGGGGPVRFGKLGGAGGAAEEDEEVEDGLAGGAGGVNAVARAGGGGGCAS